MVVSTQKGPLSRQLRLSLGPLLMVCSGGEPVLAQPCSRFLSLLTELAAQGLRTFQGVSPARPLLQAQFQQTQTDHHNPALYVGLAPQALAVGT